MSSNQQNSSAQGGLILKGDDGSVYYIRSEVLAACRAEGQDRELIEAMTDGDKAAAREVEGFSVAFAPKEDLKVIGQIGDVRGAFVGVDLRAQIDKYATSTVMCPW